MKDKCNWLVAAILAFAFLTGFDSIRPLVITLGIVAGITLGFLYLLVRFVKWSWNR